MFFDELPARLDIVTHQSGKQVVGSGGIVETNLNSVRRVGSMVVSQSCSASISPNPLNRVIFIPFSPILRTVGTTHAGPEADASRCRDRE